MKVLNIHGQKIIIRTVRFEDFSALRLLYKKVFKKNTSTTFLENKYDGSYISKPYFSSVAIYGKQIIGYYGALPQLFYNGTKNISVAHTCEYITIKEFRKKGIHQTLATFAYENMKKHEVQFAFAFHSENSYHSTKKLNWKVRYRLVRFHLKTGTLPISKVFNRLKLGSINKIITDQIFAPHRILPNQWPLVKDKLYRQRIDAPLINYKDNFSPHYLIQLGECTFWIKLVSILQVGSFYAPNLKAFEFALSKLRKLCKSAGIPEILFHMDPNDINTTYLKNISKPLPSWRLGYLKFNNSVNLDDFCFEACNFDTF
jgi:hypothetical protein